MKIAFIALVFVGSTALAQVPAPKPESLFHHLFAPHHDTPDLDQRSRSLSCAVVLITAGNRAGTGFYVSSDGDVATAAHVLGDKIVAPLSLTQFYIALVSPEVVSIKSSDDKEPEQYRVSAVLENNPDAFSADVAILKTGKRTSCWLRSASDESVRTGQHVVTLGFPGLAFGSMSMYTGIVSARLRSTLPMGKTLQGQAFTSNVEFIRAQMPLSPGYSGAPLIDDENRAIGVVTNSGAWSPDLDLLLQKLAARGPQPPSGDVPDLQILVGELAETFHDYGSPGYGDAVPMHYLKKGQVASPPPLPPAH